MKKYEKMLERRHAELPLTSIPIIGWRKIDDYEACIPSVISVFSLLSAKMMGETEKFLYQLTGPYQVVLQAKPCYNGIETQAYLLGGKN